MASIMVHLGQYSSSFTHRNHTSQSNQISGDMKLFHDTHKHKPHNTQASLFKLVHMSFSMHLYFKNDYFQKLFKIVLNLIIF